MWPRPLRPRRLPIQAKVTAKALAALIMLQHLYNFYLIYLKVAKMQHSLQHTEQGSQTPGQADRQTVRPGQQKVRKASENCKYVSSKKAKGSYAHFALFIMSKLLCRVFLRNLNIQ